MVVHFEKKLEWPLIDQVPIEPVIWIDFNKGGLSPDGYRFVILKAIGTIRDLEVNGITLAEGLGLHFYNEDVDEFGNDDYLVCSGSVSYDPQRREWWAHVRGVEHLSELQGADDHWARKVDWASVRANSRTWLRALEGRSLRSSLDEYGRAHIEVL